MAFLEAVGDVTSAIRKALQKTSKTAAVRGASALENSAVRNRIANVATDFKPGKIISAHVSETIPLMFENPSFKPLVSASRVGETSFSTSGSSSSTLANARNSQLEKERYSKPRNAIGSSTEEERASLMRVEPIEDLRKRAPEFNRYSAFYRDMDDLSRRFNQAVEAPIPLGDVKLKPIDRYLFDTPRPISARRTAVPSSAINLNDPGKDVVLYDRNRVPLSRRIRRGARRVGRVLRNTFRRGAVASNPLGFYIDDVGNNLTELSGSSRSRRSLDNLQPDSVRINGRFPTFDGQTRDINQTIPKSIDGTNRRTRNRTRILDYLNASKRGGYKNAFNRLYNSGRSYFNSRSNIKTRLTSPLSDYERRSYNNALKRRGLKDFRSGLSDFAKYYTAAAVLGRRN